MSLCQEDIVSQGLISYLEDIQWNDQSLYPDNSCVMWNTQEFLYTKILEVNLFALAYMEISLQSMGHCKNSCLHVTKISLKDSAVIQDSITSGFAYCNSLLYGRPDTELDRLQRIQNIACRILC